MVIIGFFSENSSDRQWHKCHHVSLELNDKKQGGIPMKKLISLVLTLTLVLVILAPALADANNFPLAGQRYLAYAGDTMNSDYDMTWTQDGRLWQPDLPTRKERVTHTIAVKLMAGYDYVFNGVESTLNVDLNCDGTTDQLIADHEDNKEFSIPADAGIDENGLQVVWAVVWSSTPSGGSEVIAVGPIDK